MRVTFGSPSLEHGLLASGVALVVLGFGWAFWRFPQLKKISEPIVLSPVATGAYIAPLLNAGRQDSTVWEQPTEQSRGHGWVYDLFTPPTLFRDSTTGGWSLAPLATEALETDVSNSREAEFGVEVVAIERELFPLQLVGYGGKPGSYFGMFENVATKETFLGRAGGCVRDLNFTIESVEVQRTKQPQLDVEPLIQVLATSTVLDGETRTRTILSSGERLVCGLPWAKMKRLTGEIVALQEGEFAVLEGVEFLAERIDLDAGEVVIVRSAGVGDVTVAKTFRVSVLFTVHAGRTDNALSLPLSQLNPPLAEATPFDPHLR